MQKLESVAISLRSLSAKHQFPIVYFHISNIIKIIIHFRGNLGRNGFKEAIYILGRSCFTATFKIVWMPFFFFCTTLFSDFSPVKISIHLIYLYLYYIFMYNKNLSRHTSEKSVYQLTKVSSFSRHWSVKCHRITSIYYNNIPHKNFENRILLSHTRIVLYLEGATNCCDNPNTINRNPNCNKLIITYKTHWSSNFRASHNNIAMRLFKANFRSSDKRKKKERNKKYIWKVKRRFNDFDQIDILELSP